MFIIFSIRIGCHCVEIGVLEELWWWKIAILVFCIQWLEWAAWWANCHTFGRVDGCQLGDGLTVPRQDFFGRSSTGWQIGEGRVWQAGWRPSSLWQVDRRGRCWSVLSYRFHFSSYFRVRLMFCYCFSELMSEIVVYIRYYLLYPHPPSTLIHS